MLYHIFRPKTFLILREYLTIVVKYLKITIVRYSINVVTSPSSPESLERE
ncbi:hypothetical protein [European catfish virus]|uniref:Uncharacterized protein n=1 Tax=European catfish virus TaxID=84739 RepID=I2BFW6_9VIRU|nr:hypothetical protein A190_gp136 [European catfish virus]AFJ52419.1 hypothetical protein [European catfish virus]AMZ04965.1 hypothetical protein [European catfish virus]AMZ05101.1 hypothetical protein [European catfish virus]